jgi:hypothetical protein
LQLFLKKSIIRKIKTTIPIFASLIENNRLIFIPKVTTDHNYRILSINIVFRFFSFDGFQQKRSCLSLFIKKMYKPYYISVYHIKITHRKLTN